MLHYHYAPALKNLQNRRTAVARAAPSATLVMVQPMRSSCALLGDHRVRSAGTRWGMKLKRRYHLLLLNRACPLMPSTDRKNLSARSFVLGPPVFPEGLTPPITACYMM
jgi:hypothetical protein